MKNCVGLFFILCLMYHTGYSQKRPALLVPIEDSIKSKLLNETRRLWISLPTEKKSDTTRYHVLYVLDPEAFFTLITGMVQLKSKFEKSCPEMIIVGVLNMDRIKDMTPTHSLLSVDGKENKEFLKSSGGGEVFTRFLSDELLPYIDSVYPTKPQRTLLGHSLAGLMVLNTLVHHPEVFDNYIGIDPSTWWDNRKLLQAADIGLRGDKFLNKKFFLAVSSNNNLQTDSLVISSPPVNRPIVQFAERLKNNSNELTFFWRYYGNEGHSSVVYTSFSHAIDTLWK
jgi:uncharacterized protein